MKRWITRALVGAFGASLLIGGLSACGHGHHGGWQMSDDYAPKMREKMLDRERARAFIETRTTTARTNSPEVIAAAADFCDSLTPAQQQSLRDFIS